MAYMKDSTGRRLDTFTVQEKSKQGQEDLETQRLTALRPFHGALGNRDNAACNILFTGHSFIEGVRGDAYNKTIPNLVADGLRLRFPTAGAAGGFGSKGPGSAASWPGTDALTSFGGIGNDGGTAGFGRRSWRADSASKYVQWAKGTPSTGFDIVYAKGSTRGIGYYKIDGGTAVTFDTYGPTSYGNVLQIRGLSTANHTLEVGWSSGGAVIFEIVDYNGDETKGIRVFNNGKGSQKSDYFTDTAGKWIDNLTAYPPNLHIITLMCNDFGGGYTPNTSAQVKTNLQTLIANVKAKNTAVPVATVLCIEYERAGATDQIEPWANYVAKAKEIAAADSSVITYDMAARFGAGPFSGGNGQPLVDTDNTHPDGAGYRLWADSLVNFISPR